MIGSPTKNDYEVYNALLCHNGSTIAELVGFTGLPDHTILESLNCLIFGNSVRYGEQQYCTVTKKRQKTYFAIKWVGRCAPLSPAIERAGE